MPATMDKENKNYAYHPESDGMVELFNRTLLEMLSMAISDKESGCLLPTLLMAYRTSVHENLIFGIMQDFLIIFCIPFQIENFALKRQYCLQLKKHSGEACRKVHVRDYVQTATAPETGV